MPKFRTLQERSCNGDFFRRQPILLNQDIAGPRHPADWQAGSRIYFPKNEMTYLGPKILRGIVRFHVWRNVNTDDLEQ